MHRWGKFRGHISRGRDSRSFCEYHARSVQATFQSSGSRSSGSVALGGHPSSIIHFSIELSYMACYIVVEESSSHTLPIPPQNEPQDAPNRGDSATNANILGMSSFLFVYYIYALGTIHIIQLGVQVYHNQRFFLPYIFLVIFTIIVKLKYLDCFVFLSCMCYGLFMFNKEKIKQLKDS